MGQGVRLALLQPPVQIVVVLVKSEFPRGFSLCNKLAQGAGGKEESLQIRVVHVEVVAGSKRRRLYRLRFPLALIMGIALG
tara:strand:- start:241 stop:483 length:243 start_codon:yes stop_codon:yes gene_type:complete